jgi:hypothetical protein
VVDDRALTALRGHDSELAQAAAALAIGGVADPWQVPLGDADRRLLALHRSATGRDLEVTVTCASCGTVNTAVLAPSTVPPWEPRSVWWGPGCGLREPVLADLADLPSTGAALELLRRCAVGPLPLDAEPSAVELVDTTLAGPLVVSCVDCGTSIEAPVDVEPLVLAALFRRLDAVDVEVHLLAEAYGWDLATIEALPGDRRARFASIVAEGR